MKMSESDPLPATTTGELRMTSDEAHAAIERINRHLDNARALLLDFHEREGWRALGYNSWRACAQHEVAAHIAAEDGTTAERMRYVVQTHPASTADLEAQWGAPERHREER